MPPRRTDVIETVEFDVDNKVVRFHFMDRMRYNEYGERQVLCGVQHRKHVVNTDGFSTGFYDTTRWNALQTYGWVVIYCNGCGVDAAGLIHDQRTAEIRRRNSRSFAEQASNMEA